MRDNLNMLDSLLRRSYRRLGSRHARVLLLVQIPAVALIAFVVAAVLATYYEPSVPDVILLGAISMSLSSDMTSSAAATPRAASSACERPANRPPRPWLCRPSGPSVRLP